MNRNYIGFFLLCGFLFLQCADKSVKDSNAGIDDSSASNAKNWSVYQGALNWNDAVNKCKSLNMRLPVPDELVAAKKAKLLKDDDTDFITYWSSKESAHMGDVFALDPREGKGFYHPDKDGFFGVLCIQKNVPIPPVIIPSAKEFSNWSAYQGRMNWAKANAKCKSLGMRLPNPDELAKAFESKFTESWMKDGKWMHYGFWTSEDLDSDTSTVFRIERVTQCCESNERTDRANKGSELHVRCVR